VANGSWHEERKIFHHHIIRIEKNTSKKRNATTLIGALEIIVKKGKSKKPKRGK